MLLSQCRADLVRFSKKLITAGLTSGTGGNISLSDPKTGLLAVTPSGLPYETLTAADMVVTDAVGVVKDGLNRPTSEMGLHAALYAARPDIRAVVHTHSPFAVTLACLGWEIPPVHYLVGFCGEKIPLAPYALFGTRALADAVVSAMGKNNGVLMANHGAVTVGSSLSAAFSAAEALEFCAMVYYRARLAGEPKILSREQMARVTAKIAGYGAGRKK